MQQNATSRKRVPRKWRFLLPQIRWVDKADGQMRYMLDTCAVIHLMTDYQSLSKNIHHIFESYDTQLHISSESIKELIIAYRSKGLWHKKWKKELDIIHSVATDFQIEILPIFQLLLFLFCSAMIFLFLQIQYTDSFLYFLLYRSYLK